MTTYEEARAIFDAAMSASSNDVHVGPDDDLLGMLLDWHAFWNVDRAEAEWIAEPVLAAGRSHAIFAPGGTGKSLFALWLSAALATGRPIFGNQQEPRHVLYLDYEMTEDDLAERLEAMGYGPDVDLTHLHYALLPSLPGLDEPEGGKAVVRLAELCDAELVVIDTFGRAVHGDENEADTVRAWYRWTGIHLKAAGRAFVRIDHAGKDLEKGQRGTSAKNDDVDVVWRLARQDGEAFKLTAKKRRMGWVPETVDLELRDGDGLSYALLSGGGWPPGTKELADALDRLGVPVDATTRVATEALKQASHGARRATVVAAVKYRKQAGTTSGTTFPEYTPEPSAEPESSNGKPPGHSTGTTAGTSGNHYPSPDAVPHASLDAVPQDRPPTTDQEDLFG